MSKEPSFLSALLEIEDYTKKYHEKIPFFPAVQVFLKTPMKACKLKYNKEDVQTTKAYLEKNPLYYIVHGQYILNFCRPYEEIKEFAISSVVDDLVLLIQMIPLERQEKTGVVIHVGKNVKKVSVEACISYFVENLEHVFQECDQKCDTKLRVILETSTKTKGPSDLFHDLRVLKQLYTKIVEKIDPKRIGFCVDTAHVFGSGYDLRTRSDIQTFFQTWEQLELGEILVVHLNDSAAPLGSCQDRHCELGKGYIFQDIQNSLQPLFQICREKGIPMIAETTDSLENIMQVADQCV